MKDVADYFDGVRTVTLPASDIERLKRGVNSVKQLLAVAIKKNGGEIRFSPDEAPILGEAIQFTVATDPATGETVLSLVPPVAVKPVMPTMLN